MRVSVSSLKDRERSGGPRRFDTEPLLQIYSERMRAKKEHEFICQFLMSGRQMNSVRTMCDLTRPERRLNGSHTGSLK